MPFRHKNIRELREIFVLWLIRDKEDGITGYELQNMYRIPRGSMLRLFNKMEEKGYIKANEVTEEGRVQKRYVITDQGKKRLDELRENWADKFIEMTDMAPPERFGHPFHNGRRRDRIIKEINRLENKDEALDYLRGLRHRLRKGLKRLKGREERMNFLIKKSDSIITQVENMETLDKETLKSLLKEARKEYKDMREKNQPKRNRKTCSDCGAIISKDAEYCSQCGHKIEK
jgi:DNA-binding PadR family transcriptional regulator